MEPFNWRRIMVKWCFECGEMRHASFCADCGTATGEVSFVREIDAREGMLDIMKSIKILLSSLVQIGMISPSYITTIESIIERAGGGSEG